MRSYKVYKFLFEEEKYKEISLTSKFAYCVYLDRIRQNINVKVDKEGKKHIENPRDYLIKKQSNFVDNKIRQISYIL